ncbi:hypothetical protein BVY00_01950 [bacterium G20]|nr:hypothetical protein BVY00_01950 [bacterium G20]
MNRKQLISVFVASVISFTASSAISQEWSKEQLEVWKTVKAQWKASKAQDKTWTDTYLHPSFLGWNDDTPMPLNKSSVTRWQNYQLTISKTLVQELSPVGIVVEGSMAVVHYYFSTATENLKGETKTIHGRYTDILIKDSGKWLFIAWRGGQDHRWKE